MKYTNIILDSIDSDDLAEFEVKTKQEYVVKRFTSEFVYAIKKDGLTIAAKDWLLGLALDVPYTYADIAELEGWKVDELTEDELMDVNEGYWLMLASIVKGFVISSNGGNIQYLVSNNNISSRSV